MYKAVLKISLVILSLNAIFNDDVLAGRTIPESRGKPLPVKISVIILDIDDIDGAEQNFSANVFYKSTWRDSSLANQQKEEMILPLTEIWHPRFQIVNQQRLWTTMPEDVIVRPDGTVIYRQRVWGQFSQPLNLKDFPFDEQVFDVHFITIGIFKDEIELIEDDELPCGMSEKLSQADWQIVGWEAKRKTYAPIAGIPETEGFVFTFRAKRKIGYYIMKMIIPLVLIVMMSWVVFWIDPQEAGTQVGVAVTSMLTLIAYRFATDALLPRVSYITRLDYFVLGSTILVFSGLIEVLITTNLAKNEKLAMARRVDKIARVVMPLLFIGVILKAFIF